MHFKWVIIDSFVPWPQAIKFSSYTMSRYVRTHSQGSWSGSNNGKPIFFTAVTQAYGVCFLVTECPNLSSHWERGSTNQTKIEWVLLWPIPHPFTGFCDNSFSSFCVIFNLCCSAHLNPNCANRMLGSDLGHLSSTQQVRGLSYPMVFWDISVWTTAVDQQAKIP